MRNFWSVKTKEQGHGIVLQPIISDVLTTKCLTTKVSVTNLCGMLLKTITDLKLKIDKKCHGSGTGGRENQRLERIENETEPHSVSTSEK